MCGIFGVIFLQSSDLPDGDLLDRMAQVEIHRGPDDYGHFRGNGIAMGMRRLSIIDLGGGHQPIANEDKTVWVACNGEIYNFRELRTMLEAKGHVFQCGSDTEVLVHLYEEEGLDLFKHLRGMFGIALWDVRRSRLVLGRDRLGKKPLYIRKEPGRVLFASELKSILQDEKVPRRLDHLALHEYLALGYVPAPMTLLEGIEKVLPGHYLVIENGRVEDHEYWDLRTDTIESCSEEVWVERVREKFLESVRIRMVSDVPLGAFLSGGIDSSAIVAAMARSSSEPVKTYAIGFDEEDRYYNELPYAQIVAKAYGTDHHEIIVRPQVAELLPKLIWHLDEPIADSALLTTYLVSKLASQSVKVILSGVGGDELFGGYRRYLGDGLAQYYHSIPGFLRASLRWALSKLPQDRHSGFANYVRYAAAFANSAESSPVARYISYVALFSAEARASLIAVCHSNGKGHDSRAISDVMEHYFYRARNAEQLSQMIYVDMKTSLADDLLALTDKMTMAKSIECRAPFMDHELVELASRVPSDLKIRGFTMKYLLKKVVAPWLPREILNRKKRGFGAPIGAWLRNSLDGLIQDTLSESQISKRGLFDWMVVRELIEAHRQRRSDHTDHLLALINLEIWCRIFLDGGDKQFSLEVLSVGEDAG